MDNKAREYIYGKSMMNLAYPSHICRYEEITIPSKEIIDYKVRLVENCLKRWIRRIEEGYLAIIFSSIYLRVVEKRFKNKNKKFRKRQWLKALTMTYRRKYGV